MNYLLDTNIVIVYSKNNEISRAIEEKYRLFADENNLAISIVSAGEINSLVHQLRIGEIRKANLDRLLNKLYQVDINSKDILNRYEQIDAYSQCKHKTIKSPFSTPRNMGKNDLWIAATASALGIPLVTTDKDFSHLDGVFLELFYINIQDFRRK